MQYNSPAWAVRIYLSSCPASFICPSAHLFICSAFVYSSLRCCDCEPLSSATSRSGVSLVEAGRSQGWGSEAPSNVGGPRDPHRLDAFVAAPPPPPRFSAIRTNLGIGIQKKEYKISSPLPAPFFFAHKYLVPTGLEALAAVS
ncbi:hypothetical protein BOTBODRAFT_247624 [Botryobasidium botryosum FD-172 SS1]|uniref:Uncharacterized protein n=1 Tax=Botryobasidium botryosum (strain FD-172 SS1) TaxID=930990 RepID=A0A067LW54_BOTB1|nr:hypothetical protein BOTBODRAFT_247624 [Botryobasidium botryosum FD-172 SS1]